MLYGYLGRLALSYQYFLRVGGVLISACHYKDAGLQGNLCVVADPVVVDNPSVKGYNRDIKLGITFYQ